MRPSLGPSISGTKCDRDKPFFSQKEGVNHTKSDRVEAKIQT